MLACGRVFSRGELRCGRRMDVESGRDAGTVDRRDAGTGTVPAGEGVERVVDAPIGAQA